MFRTSSSCVDNEAATVMTAGVIIPVIFVLKGLQKSANVTLAM